MCAIKTDFAKIEVAVNGFCGIMPIENAKVILKYKCVGSDKNIELESYTDEKGKSGEFSIPICHSYIGDRRRRFPNQSKCEIEISADGYVPLKIHDVPIFPAVTVKTSFNLIKKSNNPLKAT